MKVCYLPSDMDAPGFYRCLSPGRQLRDHGYDVFMPPRREKADPDGKIRTHFDMNFDLPRSADLYVLQQWRERVVSEIGIKKLRQWGSATTMDVDDNYVNIPTYSPAFVGTHEFRRTDGVILNRRERRKVRMPGKIPYSTTARAMHGIKSHQPAPPNAANRLHMLDTIQQVDLLTVSTPFLAEAYAPFHKNIEVVRNYVDWDMWDDITPQYDVERERVRIGYLAVFRYRRADLEVIRNVLPRFLNDHPEVDFVANEEEMHDFLQVPEGQRVTIGTYDFYDIETGQYRMPEMTAVCDIGLVPLAMNDLNQGKSHLKGMEYNAAGIPYIASPTESYRYWRGEAHGDGTGFLATSEDDWYELMEHMVTEEGHRKRYGRAGRRLARKHSIQQNWRAWDDVYSKLVGDECYASARGSIVRGAVQKVSELGPFLQQIRDLRPKVVVEIGTARGGTFWAMAQHAHPNAHLISMDIPAGSPMDQRNGVDVYTGRDRDKIKTFKQETQKLSLIDLDSQTPQALAVLIQALGGEKIDLLFIDGDHRYEGVKHDFDTYSQLMAPGGMVGFHDIVTHEDKRVGVDRLWSEAIKDLRFDWAQEHVGGETWGYRPWGGIGVLGGFHN